jgi:peptidoglycan/LPS O-acetylase OafA/YrhL
VTEKRHVGLDGLRGIALLSVFLFHFRFVFDPESGPVEKLLFRTGEIRVGRRYAFLRTFRVSNYFNSAEFD